MMAAFDITGYVVPKHVYYNDLDRLRVNLGSILAEPELTHTLLWYYWDNEQYAEWEVPDRVTNEIRSMDPTRPIYALQGNDGLARRYHNNDVKITDVAGTYASQATMDRLIRLNNLEQQKNPVGPATIGLSIGLAFRPRLFNAIAQGAKAITFYRDHYVNEPVEDQLWWDDLPNIREEIDQLIPVIRMLHWTSWSLTSANEMVHFGTRDYQGEGYVIATNEKDTDQQVTFTIHGLPYVPKLVKDFFTHMTETTVSGSQFTVTIPAYGSKVYVLPNIMLSLPFDESQGSTTSDTSYHGNDGTLYGNATVGAGMVTLDGSGDYVNCGNNDSLEMGTGDMTIVSRFKMSPNAGGDYAGIATKGATTNATAGYALNYHRPTGRLRLTIGDGTTRLWLDSNTNLNLHDDAWHSVAVTLDRDGVATFYVDGNPVGAEDAGAMSGADIRNANEVLRIGCWAGGWWLPGQMDFVQIFKRVLSTSEIVASEDSDGDGVLDGSDNCILVANGPTIPDAGGNIQLDTDGDGYGNICDADLNDTGFVDYPDLTLFSNVFFTPDSDADLNGDAFVDFLDLTLFSDSFFQPPGPSCCAP
jgi:hypothetical protein